MMKKIGIMVLTLNGAGLHAMQFKWLKPLAKTYIFQSSLKKTNYATFLRATNKLYATELEKELATDLLFKAIKIHDVEIVRKALKYANINELTWDGHKRTYRKGFQDCQDYYHYSALGWALKLQCDIEIVKAILEKKPDLYRVIEIGHVYGDYYGGERWKTMKLSITEIIIRNEAIKKLIKMHVRENDMQLFLKYPGDSDKNNEEEYSIPMIIPTNISCEWVFEKNPELRKEFAKALYDAAREERTSDKVDDEE